MRITAMKVYVLENVSYDWHEFRFVEGAFASFEEMSKDLDKPLFKDGSEELQEFKDETELDGHTHYEYTEYDL